MRKLNNILLKYIVFGFFWLTVLIFFSIILHTVYNAIPALRTHYIKIDSSIYKNGAEIYYDIKHKSYDVIGDRFNMLAIQRYIAVLEYKRNHEKNSDKNVSKYLYIPIDLSQISEQENTKIRQIFDISKYWNYSIFTALNYPNYLISGFNAALKSTAIIMLITILLAVPFSLCIAIILSEYTRNKRIIRIANIALSNLNAVPSVVFGICVLAFAENIINIPRGSSLIAGIALAVMSVPQISLVCYDILRSIDVSIRHAAYSLGASPSQVLFNHVLPLSYSRLLTGIVIVLMRTIGETAPLIIVGMLVILNDAPNTIMDQATTIPMQIYIWSQYSEQGFVYLAYYGIVIFIVFMFIVNACCLFLKNHAK